VRLAAAAADDRESAAMIGRRAVNLALAAAAIVCAAAAAFAQESYSTGQNIAPVYEGWEQNADGSFNLVFGYFNRNWEEEINLPVGADNVIEPGGPDQGQPTHFLPRRNRFVFRIRVPRDFGTKELVWTLNVHGKTERAYASLKADYFIDDTVIMANNGAAGMGGTDPSLKGNKPPALTVEGEKRRTVKAGASLSLVAVATDDGIPKTRAMPRLNPSFASRFTVDSATGLRLSWFVYRGAGSVVFDPPQTKVWEDTRDGGGSPWSYGWRTPPVPAGGKWIVNATFPEPGTYVLRCLAHDGGLASAEDITFVVTP
jgi:hypothetical protein